MTIEQHNKWDGWAAIEVKTYAWNAGDFTAYAQAHFQDGATKLLCVIYNCRSRAQATYQIKKWVANQEFERQLGLLQHANQ